MAEATATATETPAATAAAAPEAPAAEAPAEAAAAPAADAPGVEVQDAQLPEAAPEAAGGGGGQIDILLSTAVPVSATLGEVMVEVRQVLQLGQGSVIKLDRRLGEPIDLYLRGIKFATGHLVVVGDHLGVRIKEILPAGIAQGATV